MTRPVRSSTANAGRRWLDRLRPSYLQLLQVFLTRGRAGTLVSWRYDTLSVDHDPFPRTSDIVFIVQIKEVAYVRWL